MLCVTWFISRCRYERNQVNIRIKTMFGSSLPLVVWRRAYVLIMLFVFVVYSGVLHVLTIWVTWQVSYKRQELLSFARTWVTPVFGGVRIAYLCSFLWGFFRPVSCLPNVASVSGLSIIDCHFGFLQRSFALLTTINRKTAFLWSEYIRLS